MNSTRESRASPFAILFSSAIAAAAAGMLALALRRLAAPRTEKLRAPTSTRAPRAPRDRGRETQRAAAGVGPLMHRRYVVDIPRGRGKSDITAESLMNAIKREIASLSPAALAEFRKSRGQLREMRIGDEYEIKMLGPWNGHVRVVAVTRDSFTLITLKGHPESGHITFRVRELLTSQRLLRVSIESWARSRDSTVDLAYSKIGVGKYVQSEVWVTFLRRVCALAGLKVPPRVRIRSEEVQA